MPAWWIVNLWVISLDWMSHLSTSMEKRDVTRWNSMDWWGFFASNRGEKTVFCIITEFGLYSLKEWAIKRIFFWLYPLIKHISLYLHKDLVVSKTELFAILCVAFRVRPVPSQALGVEGHQWILAKLTKWEPLSQALLQCSAWAVQPEFSQW